MSERSEPTGPSGPTGPTGQRSPGDRRGFAVTVLVGLAAGVLAAVGGNRAWAGVHDGSAGTSLAAVTASIDQATAPLVTSLALVVLACWGVVLVTRGRFRLGIAWLGALAAVGLLVAAIGAFVAAPQQVHDAVGDAGVAVHHTGWAYAGLVAAVLALLAAGAGVRGVRGWPEMGRRYDAPTGAPAAGQDGSTSSTPPIEERTNLDLWRDIDEGRDPTERGNP